MPSKHYYEVTMTATVTRRVAANSEEEAIRKVDKNDMVHELTNYGLNSSLDAKLIPGDTPDETDDIDDIAAEILEYNSSGMHYLRPLYQQIVAINKKRVAAGLDEYDSPIFNQLTDDFMERLRQPEDD